MGGELSVVQYVEAVASICAAYGINVRHLGRVQQQERKAANKQCIDGDHPWNYATSAILLRSPKS